MKRSSLLLILLLSIAVNLGAQDIPLFSQKLTNSFLYNPAIAGHTFGSVTYSYQQSYNKVPNAPKSHFLSFHAPLQKHKFGAGINLYQEEVNFLRNTYLSAGFAHHIRFDQSMLSVGISGEFNMLRLSGSTNSDPGDPEYQILGNGSVDDFDFSTGAVYQTTYFRVGISANRMATAWMKKENTKVLSSYYTAFLQGMIPMRGGEDILEPTITYRKFSETNNTLDLGVFYSYDNRYTGGVGWRTSNAISLTAAIKITPKILVGYTHELFLGEIRNQVGGANQFTLRYDFNEYNYKESFRGNSKNSFLYHRKSRPKKYPITPESQKIKRTKIFNTARISRRSRAGRII